MVKLPTIVIVVKQWVQLWDLLLHKYEFNCHTRMIMVSMVTKHPSCSHIDWCKFCIHLGNLNISHFGMVEVTRLKSMTLRSHSLASLLDEFHENLPIGSKVISGGDAARETD